jgi:hypothetical protein
MSSRSVEYFATAAEQLNWLQQALHGIESWIVAERPRVDGRALVKVSALTPQMLGNEHSRARLFLGYAELADQPQWRTTTYGTEVDMCASRAVLIEPSIVSKAAVIAGRLAILSPAAYRERGIDEKALRSRFQRLVRSLRAQAAVAVPALLEHAPRHDAIRIDNPFLISKDVEGLARSGMQLWPDANSRLYFTLV